MKVLHIYKDFYPPVVGGIEGHLHILCKGLSANGIDVSVLVSNTVPRVEINVIDGISVTKVPEFGRFASAPINFNFFVWLYRLGKKADILHFHLPNPTAVLSYLILPLKKTVIVTYHSDIVRQVYLKKYYEPFLKLFLKKTDNILCTSPNYVNSSQVLTCYKNKCNVVPLGVQLERFTKAPKSGIAKYIHQKYGKKFILFVGKFRYYKGVKVLLCAMKEVNAKLLLIGTGPLEGDLKAQVKKENLEDKIIFLGELSDELVNAYLHACSVFILPSIYRSEAFGIVLLEAMACGKPVISTELGTGTTFININNKTGLTVPPNDDVSLAKAIQFTLDHPEKVKEFGKYGKKRVEKYFSEEKMIHETIHAYNQTLIKLAVSNKKNYRKKVLRVVPSLSDDETSQHISYLTQAIHNNGYSSKLIIGAQKDFGDCLTNSFSDQVIMVEELQNNLNPLKDIISFFKIFRLIWTEKPDIVHTHTTKAGFITHFATLFYNLFSDKCIKMVHTIHGDLVERGLNKKKVGFLKMLEGFIIHFTDTIIAISRSKKTELIENYRRFPPKRVESISLGFEKNALNHYTVFNSTLPDKYRLFDEGMSLSSSQSHILDQLSKRHLVSEIKRLYSDLTQQ